MASNDVKVIIKADVDNFRLNIGKAKKSASSMAREVNSLEKTTTKQTSAMEKQAAGARAVGGRFGELAERFTNAHKALGTAGVVALGTATAMAAGAAAAVALAAGAVALTKTAIALADELDGVIDVTDEEKEALEAADAAFESLDNSMAQATVTAGAVLAPGIADLTETFAQLTLAIDDSVFAGVKLDGAMISSAIGGSQLAAVMGLLDMATKEYEDDVRGLSETQTGFFDLWDRGTGLVTDRREALEDLQKVEEERAQAAEKADKILSDQMAAAHKSFMDFEAAAFEAEQDALKFSAQQDGERAASQAAAQEAMHEATKARIDSGLSLEAEASAAEMALAEQAFGLFSQLVTDQFKDEKAAAISGVIISTAVGIARAIAQSPPPSPFGLIGAGLVAASGAAQLAAISGAQAPTRHLGGLVDDMGKDAGNFTPPGDINIRAQSRERVLTPEQQRGGPMRVEAVFAVGSRTFEAMARRSRMIGGEVGRAADRDDAFQRRSRRG